MGSSKHEWKHIKDADWPALRKTLAEQAGKSESEIQGLAESQDSMDEVEFVMLVEEAFGIEIHL